VETKVWRVELIDCGNGYIDGWGVVSIGVNLQHCIKGVYYMSIAFDLMEGFATVLDNGLIRMERLIADTSEISVYGLDYSVDT